MNLSDPIISGVIGGALAVALSAALRRWIPKSFRGKSADKLLRDFRTPIRVTNGLSFAGLLSSLALYQWAGFSSHDWRPLSLGFGLMLSTPLAAMPIFALIARRSPTEAIVAYCLSQKMPVAVILVLMVLGLPLLVLAVWNLFT
jgi:hypothetical protein